LDQEN